VCDYRCTSVSFIKLSNRIESNYFSPNRNAPLHMCFKFDKIRFVGYGVIAEKPRVGYLLRFLSVHPVEKKKTCLGSKNDWHFLEWSRRPLSPCTVWGDRTTSVVVCFFVLFFWHAPVCQRAVRSRETQFEQALCHGLWVDFDAVFSFISEKDGPFRGTSEFAIHLQVTPQFPRNCGRKLRKFQKLAKKVCAHTTSYR